MTTIPRIIITPGEPAGIGPDIVLKAGCMEGMPPAELIVVSDPELLAARAKQLNIPIKLVPFDAKKRPHVLINELKVIPVEMPAPCKPGKLDQGNAAFVIACLELATEYCLENITDVLVTGPVHKAIINKAGFEFTGHTEFLAQFCHATDVLMLFVIDDLKVALATMHVPLSAVPKKITQEHLLRTIRLLNREMQNKFHLDHPKIYVSGLNPHAGEEGTLGREEIDIIVPTLAILRKENIDCIGPVPADTLFTEKNLQQADVFLSMYHDQALPVVKHMGFNRAVNVTLGLPIVRTSVDHGTALDLAGTGLADAGSLRAAIELAYKLI